MRGAWGIGVVVLAACGGDPVLRPILQLDGDAAKGEALYVAECAQCHSGGFGGSTMEDITGHHSKEEVLSYVYYGKDGSELDMPAFGDLFTDQELADLLAYIFETWPPP